MDLHLTLIEIPVITVIAFFIAALILMPYKLLNFGFFATLIVVTGFMHYKQTKEELIDGFYNNKELLCEKESDEKKLILSRAKGFTLQSDYFIHEDNIVYIGGCILLEDANQTEEHKK